MHRNRQGTFEPQIIEKHQTRLEGFDAKIISMYARRMTIRDIQGHLREMYGVDVSASLVSEVTVSKKWHTLQGWHEAVR